MPLLSYTVSRNVEVPVQQLFDPIVAEDVLPKVLHRYGPVPGVRGTRELTGPWTAPGSRRTVVLDDGSTATETLVVFDRPHRFEYRVEALTGPLGRLVGHAEGRWTFEETAGGSSFTWTYSFVPARGIFAPVLAPFVRLAWAGYMRRCADRCVALARER
jgi:hypothetical protein